MNDDYGWVLGVHCSGGIACEFWFETEDEAIIHRDTVIKEKQNIPVPHEPGKGESLIPFHSIHVFMIHPSVPAFTEKLKKNRFQAVMDQPPYWFRKHGRAIVMGTYMSNREES